MTLDQILPGAAQEFKPLVIKCYHDLRERIQALFTEKNAFWDKYLKANGNGINLYLEAVVQGSNPL
jgi:hypothetical protein